MNRTDSDEILAQQVIKGDLTAFEELVTRYQKPIFKIAYRMVGHKEEAEDLTQEVFIHIYQKMNHFNRKEIQTLALPGSSQHLYQQAEAQTQGGLPQF